MTDTEFGGESLDELVDAYVQRELGLQAQLDEQAQELSAQRQTIASLEEGRAQEQPRQSQHRGIGTIARLAAAAQPNAGMPTDLVAQRGVALAASQIPNFNRHRSQAVELFQTDPYWGAQLDRATHTGNPAVVAETVSAAIRVLGDRGRLQLQEETRSMKLNAQGLTGGQSGRPDPVSDDARTWARIAAAGQGTYAEIAARGR
jgi:hypothetical protein